MGAKSNRLGLYFRGLYRSADSVEHAACDVSDPIFFSRNTKPQTWENGDV